MSDFKFEVNSDGVRELLTGEPMKQVITSYTEIVLSNTGGVGYASDVQTNNRVVGRVYADDKESIKDNYENNTLLKALHE